MREALSESGVHHNERFGYDSSEISRHAEVT